MNTETRLAEILTALEAVGLNCLVMGGHAVRYYGLERNTADFDLHLAPDCWKELPMRLQQTALFAHNAVIEGPSWRPNDFRRFQLGTLPNGREEWLEFWRENHLLAPFTALFDRRELGSYGGRIIPFLGLSDLIRSKETEREIDWQDIHFLEEFLDARLLHRVAARQSDVVLALSELRSRRGFESLFQQGYFGDPARVRQALAMTNRSVTQAYLLPFIPDAGPPPSSPVPIEPVVLNRLRSVPPGSNLHLALVEVVRRQYKLAAQARDKADKELVRASQKS